MRKFLPILALFALCMVVPAAYFGSNEPISGNFLYHFTHANIFHLASNFIFLAYFKPRWSTVLPSYLIASAASFVPFTSVYLPTCGLSAMCFAMIARHDVAWRVLNWRLLVFNLALIFVPNANWKIHFVSYAISFITWKLYYHLKETN